MTKVWRTKDLPIRIPAGRGTYAVASFLIVLAAYWLYCLVVVPWVEAPARKRRHDVDLVALKQAEQEEHRRRMAELAVLFPESAWERQNPKILESDQVKLLVRDYANLGGGRVRIFPCTVIFTPDDPKRSRQARLRSSVVLEAPQGATLQFDQPLDLRRARVGQLLGGTLEGEITIRSAGQKPGPEDDLWIKTRQVHLTKRRIWTEHPVQFRFGPHEGRGRHMEIRLLPGRAGSTAATAQPGIGGLESFELRHLERLRLVLDGAALVPGDGFSRPAQAGEGGPIDVTCRGPLRLVAADRLITLEDRVFVVQHQPGGLRDQLACSTLSIRLAEPPPERRPADTAGTRSGRLGAMGLAELEPKEVVASGNPVVVDVPSRGLFARGELLQFDQWSHRIVLEGSGEVMLRISGTEIHARRVDYLAQGPGRLGRLTAAGPGWLVGRLGPAQEQFEARWSQKLQLRPDGEQQVLSLTGSASLAYGRLGSLQGREIHFWVTERPGGEEVAGPQIEPDRMLARGGVVLESPQLIGNVDELRVWFEHPEAAPPRAQPLVSVPTHSGTGGTAARLVAVPQPKGPMGPTRVAGEQINAAASAPFRLPGPLGRVGARAAASSGPAVAALSVAASRRYRIKGGVLSVGLVVRQGRPQLSRLQVDGDVDFQSFQAVEGSQRVGDPVVMRGQYVEVTDAMTSEAMAVARGDPVEWRGRGLTVSSKNIKFSRGENRLWIEGPGQLEMPLDRGGQWLALGGPGEPPAARTDGGADRSSGAASPDKPKVLVVTWQGGMVFDGRVVRFEQSVAARAGEQWLQAEALEVELARPIRFDQSSLGQSAEPRWLRCSGEVRIGGRTFGPQGLVSREEARLYNVVLDLVSGRLRAAGPGWLTRHQRGGQRPLALPVATSGGRMRQAEPAPEGRIMFLMVRFHRGIEGNLRDRQLTFDNQVRCVYGPVAGWEESLDPDDPGVLAAGAVSLSCGRLTVTQMQVPSTGRASLQLAAEGNTVVEGRQFTARAVRMTYDEAKDLLVLEGDGRVNAELFYEPYPGGPRSTSSARKIQYSPSRNHLQVFGSPSFEFTQGPSEE